MDIASVIAHNLSAWMSGSASLGTIKALSKASGVGFGTVRRARNADGNITVQNLEAIARAFKRHAIDLLNDPSTTYPISATTTNDIPAACEPSPDESELLQGFRLAPREAREILLDVAGRYANTK
ncbi:MAG: helix-turn-helix transcriptional regulator [Sulfuricella sp.]|nr:helix-turn-helix transcriptional regulator [Sulfuricella sp.]